MMYDIIGWMVAACMITSLSSGQAEVKSGLLTGRQSGGLVRRGGQQKPAGLLPVLPHPGQG